jgi:hypothetical protein
MPACFLALAAASQDAAALLLSYTVPMSWALRRRLIIIGLIAAVIALLGGVFYFTTVRSAPSCIDGKQNQGEEGIDCGGTCSYFCSASQAAPATRFVRAVSPSAGRTDVIAYIDNPNASSAASGLHYTIELYSPTNTIVAKKEGTVDLPPSSTVPVFVPNFFSGSATVARAFITFDTPTHLWYRYEDARVVPKVSNIVLTGGEMPRVRAIAVNATTVPLKNVVFIVTVFDETGDAIAASQTIAPSIPAQGSAPLVFTWPTPFLKPVGRIEVIPVIPLPLVP